MSAKVVADLHSAVEPLRREVATDETLLLLGDLVNIIDYTAMDGILVDIFGVEAVEQVLGLRAQGRFDEARAVMAKRREGREDEIATSFRTLLEGAYREVREALPKTTYVIGGNVDPPGMLDRIAGGGIELVDGQVLEIDGLRVGFLGGGLPTPLRVAGEIPEEEYDAKVDALGVVDVICSHVPPDVPELTYDILARRHERGSAHLAAYIHDVQPLKVYFGHVHQPMISSMHIGRSHLVNVGYFRRTGRALEFMT